MDKSLISAISQKKYVAEVYDRAASSYDQKGPHFFSYFGQKLVEFMELRPDSTVLDVACGRGACYFPAAISLNSSGKLVAMDFSSEMLTLLAADPRFPINPTDSLVQMDAEQLSLRENCVDAILCGFSIFFYPRPEQAIQEFHRVLKPGGSIGISIWGPRDERWGWWFQLCSRYQDVFIPMPDLVCNELGNPENLQIALEKAGFVSANMKMVSDEFYYMTETEWWDSLWSHGSRTVLEKLPEESLRDFRSDAFWELQAVHTQKGFAQIWRSVLVRAFKQK